MDVNPSDCSRVVASGREKILCPSVEEKLEGWSVVDGNKVDCVKEPVCPVKRMGDTPLVDDAIAPLEDTSEGLSIVDESKVDCVEEPVCPVKREGDNPLIDPNKVV